MNTSTMIAQLMSVEAAPQNRLKMKMANTQTTMASYQSVNAKLSAFKSAAADLGQLSTWRSIKATSSSANVTATATGDVSSTSGSLTFDVRQVSSKQATTLRVNTATTDEVVDGVTTKVGVPITGSTSLSITPRKYADDGTYTDGTAVPVDISADQSAYGIMKAVNEANLGIRAYVVKTAEGEGVLQFTSSKSGGDNGFVVDGLDTAGLGGTSPQTTVPKNTILDVGGGGAGYSVSSSTNTFTGLMAGVTITVAKEETGVTIDAAADVSGIAAKFQALVDAANATLTEITSQTAYDAGTKRGSPLTGDFMVRQISQTLLSAVSVGLTYDNPKYDAGGPVDDVTNPKTINGGSFAKYGIQLNRDGQLSFDAAKFTASYNEAPTAIQQAGIGLGDNFKALAMKQSTSVTAVITGRKNEIDTYTDQISNWDVRLATKKQALQRQYANLETSLGKLKNQSTWLAGQLGGLS
ncbi:flagellar filament capping protein FliD [Micromonosporaceae bacterium Da 78-11]